jgi:hypothetical protein
MQARVHSVVANYAVSKASDKAVRITSYLVHYSQIGKVYAEKERGQDNAMRTTRLGFLLIRSSKAEPPTVGFRRAPREIV